MRLSRVLITMTLLLLPGVLILCGGCAGNKVILHPIEKVDIVEMTAGSSYTPEKDGWFLSDYYLKKVVEAKVQ